MQNHIKQWKSHIKTISNSHKNNVKSHLVSQASHENNIELEHNMCVYRDCLDNHNTYYHFFGGGASFFESPV